MAITLPLGIRVAAGLVGMAIDRLSTIPGELPSLAVTFAGQALRTSMRVQQEVAELATRGDDLLSPLTGRFQENPAWATFDEDEDEDEDADRATGRVAARSAYSNAQGWDYPAGSAGEDLAGSAAGDPVGVPIDDVIEDLEAAVLGEEPAGALSGAATSTGGAASGFDPITKAGVRRRRRTTVGDVDGAAGDAVAPGDALAPEEVGTGIGSAASGPGNPASFVVGTGTAPEVIPGDGLPDGSVVADLPTRPAAVRPDGPAAPTLPAGGPLADRPLPDAMPADDLAGGVFTPRPAPAKPVANARRTTAKPRARAATVRSDHRLSIAELKERTQGMDAAQITALLAQEEAGPNRAAYLTLLANRLMTLQHENR